MNVDPSQSEPEQESDPEKVPLPSSECISEDGIVHGGESELQDSIIAAIQTCYDPEIPVDVYQLGLIYRVVVSDGNEIDVDMTLTSPNCPVAGTLPGEVEQAIASVNGVGSVRVGIVWDPPWGPEKMSEAARLQLGLF